MKSDELEKIIAEIECSELHRAPDYLKESILKKIEHIDTINSIEVFPIRNLSIEELKKDIAKQKHKKMLLYTLKTSAGIAVAVAMLVCSPFISTLSEKVSDAREERIKQQSEAFFEGIDNQSDSFGERIQKYIDNMMEDVNNG